MGAFVFVPARLNWLVTLHLFGDSLAMWCVRIRLALRLRTAPVAESCSSLAKPPRKFTRGFYFCRRDPTPPPEELRS